MSDFTQFKRQRIESISDKYDLDLLIGSLPENVYYLTGFQSISHQTLNRVQAFSLYHRKNGNVFAVLPRADVATFVEQFENLDAICHGNFFFEFPEDQSPATKKIKSITEAGFDSPTQSLSAAIKRTGIKRGRVGLDESRVTPQLWLSLTEMFPEVEFVPAEGIFGEIRMIKHSEEVGYLEKAAEISEDSLLAALSEAHIGMTELELEQLYIEQVVKRGGRPFFNIMTEGIRTAYVDTINTDRQIVDGSVMRFDIGCLYQGYRSDIARTAVVGKTSSKVEDYYRYILEGEDRLVEHVRPGVTAEELFNVAVDKVREGIPHYKRQHVGHGIGLEVYDPPALSPGIDIQLEPGMVLCIETPYYELEWGGVQVEDTVVVTETGHRFLTKSSRELIRIGG